MLRIGLTGGIGSGKSVVADRLQALGASIVDTDVIAHDLTAAQGAAMPAIRAAFGDAAVGTDGAMDRAHMRARVFADPEARRQLEGILHPMIQQEVTRQAAQATGLYVVFVVPLLVESGRWRDRVARICVVDCPPEDQIVRVQARSGLTVDAVARIMQTQATREARLAVADDVIDNGASVSLAGLSAQVDALHARWQQLAGA